MRPQTSSAPNRKRATSRPEKQPGKRRGQSSTPSAAEDQPYVVQCAHPANRIVPKFAPSDYITGENFVVGFCHDCRLHVTTPVPGIEQVGKYYPSTYYGSGQRFNPIVELLLDNLYKYRVRQIGSHKKPGKVLDIGCGRGILLGKLRDKGWDPIGTELSEGAATYARDKLHLPVIAKDLKDCNFPDEEFDLVIIWHVLEHVPAPRDMLQEVSRILKPGGVLLVAVPNFGSWESRWTGPGWFHLDVPRHLTHFTLNTLNDALNHAGLSLMSTNFFSTEYDYFSFVQSIQNKLGFRHNLLYNLLRTRSAKVFNPMGETERASLLEAMMVLLTALPLGIVSFFATPLIAASRHGATIAAYAIKPLKT